MATDAILTLERLRCIRESDGSGHSEPYLWPVLLWVDDDTLTTPELVGVTAPALGNARVVFHDEMRAGQTAPIPPSTGVLRVRLDDNQTVRRIIIAVILLEEDETPEAAMRKGFQAFPRELRTAIAENLFALNSATDTERDELVKVITKRVEDAVKSAIRGGLTSWQKTRVFLGTLNLDDALGSAFRYFEQLRNETFTLRFDKSSSNVFEIDGRIEAKRVVVDRCQARVDAVKAAQSTVNSIEAQISSLQEQLHGGGDGPSLPKPAILAEIRRLRQEELGPAMDALDEARAALLACRNWRPRPPVVGNLPDLAVLT